MKQAILFKDYEYGGGTVVMEMRLEELSPEIRGANYFDRQEVALGPRCNYAYQLLYVFAGEGRGRVREEEFKLEPGLLVLYGPGDRHEFRSVPPGGRLALATMNFSWSKPCARKLAMGNKSVPEPGKGFRSLADPMIAVEGLPRIPFRLIVPGGRRNAIERLLKEAGREFRRPGGPQGQAILKCKAALLETVRALALHFAESEGGEHPALKALDETLAKRHPERLTRDEAAKEAGISPSRLTALLREKRGTNFEELLERTRMEAACETLEFSRLSVKEIASRCGFADASYFVARFKKLFGKPPGAWRA